MGTAEPLTFLTDFADQAVMLPLVLAAAAVLASQGWRRGALAWLAAIGGTFSVVLALKLLFVGCTPVFGPANLSSPSGHVAAAAVVCGGLATIYGGGRRTVAIVAVLAAFVIGFTRVGLHEHTWPEAALGAVIGLTGAIAMTRLAGPPPLLRLRPMVLTATLVLALFHGRHLRAEAAIREAAMGSDWLPAWCHTRP